MYAQVLKLPEVIKINCKLHLSFFIAFLFSLTCSTNAQVLSPSGNVVICGSRIFSVTGAPSGTTYQWQLNGTDLPGATNATYSASLPGSYTVILGGASSGTLGPLVATMGTAPVVLFDNTPDVCSGNAVAFTSTVTGVAPFSYAWNFGDPTSGSANTSTLANPVHTFVSLGCGTASYTVTLTVTDANGCITSFQKTATIKQAPDVALFDPVHPLASPPFRNCDNNPTPGNPNFTITVGNASANAACITSYTLNWGDGSPLVSPATFPLTHTYSQLGSYNMTVTATGANGCTSSKTYLVVNMSNPAGSLGTMGSTTGLCAPAQVPFVISGWDTNLPGTTYTIRFGDGRDTVLTHPLNATNTPQIINHIYNTSSCPAPTYTATLYVKNDCDSTPYTAGNIQVRVKPAASFTAPANGCTGQNICFTFNGTPGSFGASCNAPNIYNWNFDDGSPNGNTQSPCHVFNTPGTYNVTLTASNGCGTSTFQQQVCISAPPVPSFVMDTSALCLSGTVRFTNTSSVGTCAAVKYNWAVSYAAAYCGTVSSWAFAPGSTDSSVSPSIIFNNPGIYTIRLTITGPCAPVTIQKTVKVKKAPVVALQNIPATACGQVTICPGRTVTNCADSALTYLWLLDGQPAGNSQNADPGCFDITTTGTHVVSLSVTNECGTTTATQNIVISPGSNLSLDIPSPRVYCPGDATGNFLFTSTTPGATITWANTNTAIGLPASGNGNISSFTATNATASPLTATVTVTAAANGCPAQSSFTITVNPKPVLPLAPNNPVNYCKDDLAVPLSATALPGHTLLWYAAATGGTGNATPPTPATGATGASTYYVSQVNTATGCESNRLAITVNVYPVPNIGSAQATQPSACGVSNGSITLTGLQPSTTYTVRYTRNGNPQSVTLAANALGEITIGGLGTGTYNNIQVTLNGCASNGVGPFDLADPNPPATPTAGANSPICAGQALNFTASSATPGVTYSWTGPGSFSSTAQNPVINAPGPANSGTYSVTVSLNNCTSAPALVNVLVHPTPAAPTAASPVNVCANDTIRLQGSSSFPGAITYSWNGPNGFNSSLQNPQIPNADASMSGTYNLTVTSATGNCVSPSTPVTVNVLPRPMITDSSFTHPVNCNTATGSISLIGLQSSTTFTVQYTKDANPPQTVSLTSNASGTLIINNLAAGTYTNILVILNGCASRNAGPFVLVDPNPPATPTAGSNSPVCAGQTITFTASSATAGSSYSWNGPGAFTSTLQNPVINGATASNNGTYSVIAIVNGCRSAAAQVPVLVNPVPAAPAAPSPVNVCANDTIRLQGSSAFPGGVTYSWTGPNGFSSSQQNPLIPNATAAMNGTYQLTVTSINGNCVSPATPVNVNVLPLPFISSSSHVNPVGCNTATGSIILNGLQPLTTYTVRYIRNGGAPVLVTALTNSAGTILIGSLPAGLYNVSVSLNGCVSNTVNFMLTDTAPFSVDAATGGEICAGGNLLLSTSITTSGSATYAWTGPNGFSSNLQAPVISNAGLAYNGTFYVAVTVNGCTATDSVTASISAKPVGGTLVPNNAVVCKGRNNGLINLTGYFGNILRWEASINNGATWQPVNNNASSLQYNNLTVDHWYRAVIQNGVCPFAYSDTAKIVAVKGVESVSINKPSFGTCVHDTAVQLTATPVYTGTGPVRYFWYVNGQLANTGNSFTLNIRVPADFPADSLLRIKVVAENSQGCGDSSFMEITVHPIPRLSVRKRNDITCAFGDALLELSGGRQYQWQPTAFTRFIDSVAVLVVNPTATTTYRITAISEHGCVSKDTAVRVNVDQGTLTNEYLVPSAFTPNGDGVNETIGVNVRALRNTNNFELRIYNRWGFQVFQTTDPAKQWDGYYNKKKIQDTYVYYLKANTICGTTEKMLKGTIILTL